MTKPMSKDEAVESATALVGKCLFYREQFGPGEVEDDRAIDAVAHILALMETHRLIPVETAEQCLRVAELLADEGVVAAGPISPEFRKDFRKLVSALKGDTHG